MDDSHRDDCLILVENKGLSWLKSLKELVLSTLPTTLNSSSINNFFVLSSSRQKTRSLVFSSKNLVLSSSRQKTRSFVPRGVIEGELRRVLYFLITLWNKRKEYHLLFLLNIVGLSSIPACRQYLIAAKDHS